MTQISEFSDPRLVAIYDTVNPIDGYQDFYLELAAQLRARTIIDIGCGTGLLSCELARQGHNIIGVEPSPAMLDIARQRDYGTAKVRWVEGYATALGEEGSDLAILTGHVAQFFLEDEQWQVALDSIHNALRPGGYLAFESRNPQVPPFVTWPTEAAPRTVEDAIAGEVRWWWQPLEQSDKRLHYQIHYRFMESSEHIVSEKALVVRLEAELRQSLIEAGFIVESVFGYWDKSLVVETSPELIFVAKKE